MLAASIINPVMLVLLVAQIGLKLFVFVDAVRRPEAVFSAADKQTKPFWLIVLGLGLVAQLVLPSAIGILAILGTIAALVYLVDARPALNAVGRGGGGGQGPYGPY